MILRQRGLAGSLVRLMRCFRNLETIFGPIPASDTNLLPLVLGVPRRSIGRGGVVSELTAAALRVDTFLVGFAELVSMDG